MLEKIDRLNSNILVAQNCATKYDSWYSIVYHSIVHDIDENILIYHAEWCIIVIDEGVIEWTEWKRLDHGLDLAKKSSEKDMAFQRGHLKAGNQETENIKTM